MTYLEGVFKLQELQVQRAVVETSIKEMSQPAFRDYVDMPAVFQTIKASIPADVKTYYRRQVGLITLLLLYSPESMSDVCRIPRGLRDALAKTTGIIPSSVTRIIQQARFMLCHNREFREDVDYVITKLIK